MTDNKKGSPHTTPESFTNFGDLLRYLRHRAAITQRELAIQVGYHYSYLSRIERNERLPEPNMVLARFVPALQVADEPAWAARLVELAALGRQETLETGLTLTQMTTTAVPVESLPLPDLPQALTSLLGRENEVAILRQLLASPQVRLLTLTGPPGIGKTRLAGQIGAEIGSQLADGSLFVDLSGVRDPALLPSALLQAYNLPEAAGDMAETVLQQTLHGREQLLILDNFEQIISAAPLVSRLLRYAPRLKILVTSREILRLHGENEFAVPPLPTEPELGAPAVRLFAQRAQAIQPGWQLTATNEPIVAELCQRLDGLPLAIELAAARIKLFAPEAMLARLDKRLGWLTGGKRDEQAWRQTMRGAIEWSYQLLTEREKQLWEGLALFFGGGTLTAVEEVAGGDLDTLVALADKNLLTLRPALTAEDDLRFGWLESLREFAAERLAHQPQRQTALSLAHAQFFHRFVAECTAQRQQTKTAVWLTNIDEAYSNIRAALTWATTNQQGVLALGLCVDLVDYWEIRGLFAEGRYWLKTAVSLSQLSEPSYLLAKAWHGRGRLTMRQNDYDEALAYYRHSIAIWQALGDQSAQAQALLDLGKILAAEKGRSRAQDSYFADALAIYKQLGDVRGMGMALNQLGLNAYAEQDFVAARHYIEESLACRRTFNDPLLVTGSLNNLGLVAYALGDYEAARVYHEEALQVRQRFGLEGWLCQSRANLALTLIRLGRIAEAETLAIASLQLAQRQKLKMSMVEVCEVLALIAAERQQVARAACLLGGTTRLRQVLDAPRDGPQEGDVVWLKEMLSTAVDTPLWQKNWAIGQQLTLDQLTSIALDETDAPAQPAVANHTSLPRNQF